MSSAEISLEGWEGGVVVSRESLEGGKWRQWKDDLSSGGKFLVTKDISPSLRKERLDVPDSDSSCLLPTSPLFGIVKVIPYGEPGDCAHMLCFPYAVTGLAYMSLFTSLNKDRVWTLDS